LGLNY